MNPSNESNLRTGLRWILGLLFLWAAASKLGNPTDFLGSVYAYQLPLPRSLQQFSSIVIPWIELLCGLLLLANLWIDSALICVFSLMCLFVLATGQAWLRGLEISCGCFNLALLGIDENHPRLVKFLESAGFAFFRNLVLTGGAFYLLKGKIEEIKASLAPDRPPLKPAKRAA